MNIFDVFSLFHYFIISLFHYFILSLFERKLSVSFISLKSDSKRIIYQSIYLFQSFYLLILDVFNETRLSYSALMHYILHCCKWMNYYISLEKSKFDRSRSIICFMFYVFILWFFYSFILWYFNVCWKMSQYDNWFFDCLLFSLKRDS